MAFWPSREKLGLMNGYKFRWSMHEEKDGAEEDRLASGETDDVSGEKN